MDYWKEAVQWSAAATWAVVVDRPIASAVFFVLVLVAQLLIQNRKAFRAIWTSLRDGPVAATRSLIRNPEALAKFASRRISPTFKLVLTLAFAFFFVMLLIVAPVYITSELRDQKQNAEGLVSELTARIDALEIQNTALVSQRETLRSHNDELTALLHGRAVGPTKFSAVLTKPWINPQHPDLYPTRVLVIPSRTVSPAKFTISVDKELVQVSATILGAGTVIANGPVIFDRDRRARVDIASPAAGPGSPLEVTLYATSYIDRVNLTYDGD